MSPGPTYMWALQCSVFFFKYIHSFQFPFSCTKKEGFIIKLEAWEVPSNFLFVRRRIVLALNEVNRIIKDFVLKSTGSFQQLLHPVKLVSEVLWFPKPLRFLPADCSEVSLFGSSSFPYAFPHGLFWVCTSCLWWQFNFSFFISLGTGEKST